MMNGVKSSSLERFIPRECTLFMTDRCNLKCAGCSRAVLGVKEFREMKLGTVKKLLSLYPSIEGFCVAGLGEPTLCTDFVEIFDFLISRGKYTGLITNGTNIDKILKLNGDPGYISISLYGYDRESYMAHTGVDAFSRVIENYRKVKSRFKKVGFSYIVKKDNYRSLEKILSFCDELRPEFLNLVNYLAYDYKKDDDIKNIITIKDKEIISYIEDICRDKDYIGVKPVCLNVNNDNYFCESYNYLINLDGDGNTGGCQRQIPPDKSYGNIFLEDDPFNSPSMMELRKKMQKNAYPHEECRFCFGRMGMGAVNIDLAVLILFYEKVEQTLECITGLLPSKVNIYILNNNSSDAARKKLGEFCAEYRQVKIFDSSVNLGVGVGRNYLINHTSEEWLLFIDNDITVKTSEWHRKIASYVNLYKDTEVFIPGLFNIHDNSYSAYSNLVIEDNKVIHKPVINSNTSSFPGGASFINRRLFQRVGLYDEKMFIGLEDFEFSIRAILSGEPVRARLISDIELVHDHRCVTKAEDKKSVLVRYDTKTIEDSFKRIHEKYKNLIFEHDWKPWVINQIDKLLSKDNLDLTVTTPVKNFASKSECRNLPAYSGEKENIFIDFYKEAFVLAESIEAASVINFGLQTFETRKNFEDAGIVITEVDFNNLIKDGKEESSSKSFIPCDLSDYKELETLYDSLKKEDIQIFLLPLVLETLQDPRPLLRTLKRLLLLNARNRLLILSPDRERNFENDFSLPDNGAFVRHWSQSELILFLRSSGFIIEEIKDIKLQTSCKDIKSSLILTGFNREEYNLFLQANHLPHCDIEYLICTNEHGRAKLTGGIGSYVEEMEKVFPKNRLAVCALGKGDLLPETFILKEEKIIHPLIFFDSSYIDTLPVSEITFQTVEQIIYFYPDLKIIECQDVEGYGVRIVQARLSGLLPPDIITKICCHGSKIQLEKVNNMWLDLYNFRIMDEERISIELSDIIAVPTDFIYNLYMSAGYLINPDKLLKLRLPFTYNINTVEIKYKKIDTLIFFGKRIFYKGYFIFAEAIKILLNKDFLKNINEIILLGPRFENMKEENRFFDTLKKGFKVTELSLKREDAIRKISDCADRAICVMPYLSDNHPYSVLEAISTGCQLLAARAGGIPELIPEEFQSSLLCPPSGTGIAEAIEKIYAFTPEERQDMIKALFKKVCEEQEMINRRNFDLPADIYNKIANKKMLAKKGKAQIIVACSNIKEDYLEDLIYGLNNQTVKPEKVVFAIYDTDLIYIEKLTDHINKRLLLPFEIIIDNKSSNSAGARNTAIGHITSDYIITLDPHNIPGRNFLKDYVNYLDNNPDIPAVTSYCDIFYDRTEWQKSSNIIDTYRPFGDFSMLFGQIKNLFGHSDSAYRTDFLKDLEGWNDASDDDFTDWALFLKIKSHNKRIGVIPRANILKRNHLEKADRGDSEYRKQWDLAVNTLSLTHFDAFRLQSIILAYEKMYERFAQVDNIVPIFLDISQELRQEVTRIKEKNTYNGLLEGNFVQLFVDTGAGFDESTSLVKEVDCDKEPVEFDLSNYKNIKSLRFDPANEPVVLRLESIRIVANGMEYNNLRYTSNALIEKHNILIFDTDDPQIYIHIKELAGADRLICRLKYIALGRDCYKYVLLDRKNKGLLTGGRNFAIKLINKVFPRNGTLRNKIKALLGPIIHYIK